MPGTTPLTGTPYALLPDPPNIEQAGKPGFENLEQFSVPRFGSVGERNTAFLTVDEVQGMVCWTAGQLFVYTGATWEELSLYTGSKTSVYSASTLSDNAANTTEQDMAGLSVTFATVKTNAIYVATASLTADIQASIITLRAFLNIDGANHAHSVVAQGINEHVTYAPCSRTWTGTLASAGSHTLKMRMSKSSGAATCIWDGPPGSSLIVTVFEVV